jgi:hypothetical protein
MSLLELLEKLFKKDLYENLIWLEWLANKKDCRKCIDDWMLKNEQPPKCHDCIPARSIIRKKFKSTEKEIK